MVADFFGNCLTLILQSDEATTPITHTKAEPCWKHLEKQKTDDGQLSRHKLISEWALLVPQLQSKHQKEISEELWPIGREMIAFELMDV